MQEWWQYKKKLMLSVGYFITLEPAMWFLINPSQRILKVTCHSYCVSFVMGLESLFNFHSKKQYNLHSWLNVGLLKFQSSIKFICTSNIIQKTNNLLYGN